MAKSAQSVRIFSDSPAYTLLKTVRDFSGSTAKKIIEASGLSGGWLSALGGRFVNDGWVSEDRTVRPKKFNITELGLQVLKKIEERGDQWEHIGSYNLPVKNGQIEAKKAYFSLIQEVNANPGKNIKDYKSFSQMMQLKDSFEKGTFTEYDFDVAFGGQWYLRDWGLTDSVDSHKVFKFSGENGEGVSLTEKGLEILKLIELNAVIEK